MTLSFVEFMEQINPPYKIPEYIKSFLKDIKSNKRYCVTVHKRYSKSVLNGIYKKYLEGDK